MHNLSFSSSLFYYSFEKYSKQKHKSIADNKIKQIPYIFNRDGTWLPYEQIFEKIESDLKKYSNSILFLMRNAKKHPYKLILIRYSFIP